MKSKKDWTEYSFKNLEQKLLPSFQFLKNSSFAHKAFSKLKKKKITKKKKEKKQNNQTQNKIRPEKQNKLICVSCQFAWLVFLSFSPGT